MTRTTSRLPLFLLSAALLLPISPAHSADALPGGSFSETQKAEINQMIGAYLKANPGAVYESLQLFQQQSQEQMLNLAQQRITENKDAIEGKDLPFAGNPNGDVTIAEFYDYNCGYCKRTIDDIQKVLDSDKNIRVVFHELAILGPTSEIAARWSQAAFKQGKFFAFHSALMHHAGGVDEAALTEAAKAAGLDIDQLKKDAASPEIKKAVDDSRELAMSLQIHGTPGFVINGKLYPGYLGEDGLKSAIAEARKAKD